MAAALLDAGGSARATDDTGNTALHLACLNGHGRLAKVLLKNGANAGAKNEHGQTALELVPAKGKSALGYDKRGLSISIEELNKTIAKKAGGSRKK